MQMSNELKRVLAHHVYERARSMLMVAAPAMKPWDDLTGDEQAQCMKAMEMWLAGLGSNEVGEEWFSRSGHFPSAIWDQLPDGPDRTVFILAGLDLITQLIALAERGKESEQQS